MTQDDAFAQLVARVGACSGGPVLVSDEELTLWPPTAVASMKSQKLLVKARAGKSVVCPGCEEECVMPVQIVKDAAQRTTAFVVCDKRSDINRVVIPAGRLKQWRSDAAMLCAFIARDLGVRAAGEVTAEERLRQIGVVKGAKRSQMLCLRVAGEVSLVVGESALPLSGVVTFRDGKFAVDAEMVRQLVDSARTADPRYTPTGVRREARKRETKDMYATWCAEYRGLKRERPSMSDTACARLIVKRGLAAGRSPETVRKHMK